MLIISRRDEERLGLPQVFDACRCYSPQGRQLKAKRTFYTPADRALLKIEFDAVDLLIAFLNAHPQDVRRARVALGRFRDLRGTLSGLAQRRLLEVTELFELKQALQLFRELSVSEPLLRAASVEVVAMPQAEALLDPGDRKTSGFYLYDEYSPRLAELRQQRASIERELESGDRLCGCALQKKCDMAADQSQTTADAPYGETDDTTKAGARDVLLARRAELVAEEDQEEIAIRVQLTDALAVYLEALKANFDAVGVLDFRLARAVLADQWGAGKPLILEEGKAARLDDMRHPVIEEDLKKRGATFVRQSVSIPTGTTVLSGPNMGGKSVTLKSMTLALVLIQLGYYPSAASSETPLYDFISYSSDHLDTTKRGLSTFGHEMVRIRDDAARARTMRGLVVMDEPCRGTNPEEATALVGALARFYSKQKASLVISTHYRVPEGDGIAHVRIRGIRTEALDAIASEGVPASDSDAIRRIEALMDYRLERADGNASIPTDAIAIAELLGLDREILALIGGVQNKRAAATDDRHVPHK